MSSIDDVRMRVKTNLTVFVHDFFPLSFFVLFCLSWFVFFFYLSCFCNLLSCSNLLLESFFQRLFHVQFIINLVDLQDLVFCMVSVSVNILRLVLYHFTDVCMLKRYSQASINWHLLWIINRKRFLQTKNILRAFSSRKKHERRHFNVTNALFYYLSFTSLTWQIRAVTQ